MGVQRKMAQNWKELKYLWRSDLYRDFGNVKGKTILRSLLVEATFRYMLLMRFCSYLNGRRSNIFGRITYRIFHELLRHYQIKYGIFIQPTTKIGSGFYIGHIGAIVVNEKAVIGKNCNISQCVTIGQTNRGEKMGTPVIGDNVFIGPGAVVIGNIHIGNNVAIGANAVITKDVPDNAVVVGNPCKIISYEGSTGYINRTDY
jgi:serine O-acetyltransferase